MNPTRKTAEEIEADEEPLARILLVGGSPWLRHSLATLVAAERWLEVCGNTGAPASARRICVEKQPDLIVLDMELPDASGLGLLRDFIQMRPGVGILALGEREDSPWLARVFRTGARGYLSKQDETREMSAALWRVARGERVVSRRVSELVLEDVTSGRGPRAEQGEETLSRRESEVFSLLGKNHGPTAISHRLGITVKTVESHCQRIKRKLGLSDGRAVKQRAARWLLGGSGPALTSAHLLLATATQFLALSGDGLGAV